MSGRHVLHIRDSGGIFGGERAILTLARNLDPDLFNLTLLCMRRPDGRSDELVSLARGMGIRVLPLDVRGRLDLRAVAALRDFIRQNGVSLVHTHDFKSDFYGVWATAGMDVKRVATSHGSTRDSVLKRAYLFLDERLAYRFMHKVITVSLDLQDKLSPLDAAGDKFVVIPNGLDPDLLGLTPGDDGPPLAFRRHPGMKTFTVVGRLFRDKGQSVFIRAFSHIAFEFPQAAALIAGEGPEMDELKRLAGSLGLSERVHFLGVRKNIREVYDQTDFLVIPSFTEGLPYALLEAMALGIPVLATAVGGIPGVVRNGVTGYLAPAGDDFSLAERMRDLMNMPRFAEAMAEAGKRFVEETCSARAMARKTESLYLSLTG